MTLLELLIVMAIIAILSVIVPNLLRANRIAANEASAITTVRNMVSAQITYLTTVGGGGYGSMADLEGALLVDSVVANGTKDGYSFSVSLGALNASFSVGARPTTYDFSGIRSFYTDDSGVIRFTTADAPATSADDPL